MLQQGRFFQPTFTTIYKYIAIYIRIQGMCNVPVQCRQHCRPLRTDIHEARKYFLSMFPDDQPPNARVLNKLFAHELFERMSKLFQGLLRNLGTSVSGDEKLFHFTGNSCHIMVVPSKALSNRYVDVSTGSSAWQWSSFSYSHENDGS